MKDLSKNIFMQFQVISDPSSLHEDGTYKFDKELELIVQEIKDKISNDISTSVVIGSVLEGSFVNKAFTTEVSISFNDTEELSDIIIKEERYDNRGLFSTKDNVRVLSDINQKVCNDIFWKAMGLFDITNHIVLNKYKPDIVSINISSECIGFTVVLS